MSGILFFIFASCHPLSVRDEFHTTSAYSKRGRMCPLYTVISSSFLKPNLFNILNIYRRWLVLEISSEIFLSQERSCWSQTPSIFAWSTKLRGQPLIFNSVGWGTSVLKHIWRAWHFAGFKLRLLFSFHWLNESRITCNWLESGCVQFSAIVRSSTYFQQLTGPELFCTASLIITWKLMGPNLVPCSRLADKVAKSERVELYLTHYIRLLRKSYNQGTMDLRTLMWINVSINKLWSTILKAFENSVRTTVPTLLTLPWYKKWSRLT